MGKTVSLSEEDLTPKKQRADSAKTVGLSEGDLTPKKLRPQSASRQRGVVPSSELVPMQFRMPPEFAHEFRLEALRHGKKYNEFLVFIYEKFKAAK